MEFTSQQTAALNAIKNGQNVLLTGPGGVGKSTIIKQLLKIKPGVFITAMTGAAATFSIMYRSCKRYRRIYGI
jgi:ABC-type iron transport system FetAB ATPase subunit